ncbi:MAG: 2,3-bisphosphoglycerate-independent phosphoglycerate mutase [Coriobacteriia bacterium]|nr:2,3-bisphosphoglycerate-independent phosphoglycerate mutase [Coriobacteriia bacterium]
MFSIGKAETENIMRTPTLLAILDGVGLAEPSKTNAVTSADAPFLHELFSNTTYPCRNLSAAGRDVGLPEGQMGNSEVGHLNIGSGRIVNQELTRIDAAIEDGSLNQNEALLTAFDAAKQEGGTVHFMGLVSDGGVHSMLTHLEALIEMAAKNGNKRIRVHAFMDGRDVAPTSGSAYLEKLDAFMTKTVSKHFGLNLRVGSVMGRYYAMDRDNRWERLERAWRTLVVPVEPDVTQVFAEKTPASVAQASYDNGVTDEFIEPVAIGTHGITDGDTIVFFNFRPDRARELTRAFIDPDFENYGFERPVAPQVTYVCMTEYDPVFAAEFGALVAFPKTFPENTLSDYLASLGLRQLHIAETEKYAHVTFFFNGGIEQPKKDEQRILIPSPQVATYDLQPQMSAAEVTDALVTAIEQDAADVYIVNYANGDMVGHTGVLPAAIAAMEAVDAGLKRVVEAVCAKGGVALVTADHGNSEQMVDDTGEPWTAHTTNDVPLVLLDFSEENKRELDGAGTARLADIAPTLLDLMELPIPPEFTGRSLLLKK